MFVYVADLLLVIGDPLKDLSVLSDQAEHLDLIVRGSDIVKNTKLLAYSLLEE